MKKRDLEDITSTLLDVGVADGDPDRRAKYARDLAGFAKPQDVELVARWLEATNRLEDVAALMVQRIRDGDVFADTLEAAKRWDARQVKEPGARDRRDDMAHETHSKRDRYRLGMAAYSTIANLEATSVQGALNRLEMATGISRMELTPQLPELLRLGAECYQDPCPELASRLLSEGDVTSWSSWIALHRQRVQRVRSKNGARDAEHATSLVEAVPFGELAIQKAATPARCRERTKMAAAAEALRESSGWGLRVTVQDVTIRQVS